MTFVFIYARGTMFLTPNCDKIGGLVRNGAKPRNKPKRLNSHGAEMKHSALHKQLVAFEDFQTNILPALQRDVTAGLTAKQMREKYTAVVQARLITDVLMTQDPKEAATIGKDLIDRVEGKATEKKEVTHRFSEMSDKELDAVLKSEEEDLVAMEKRFEQ
jgi:hypothetical protein